MGMTLVNYTKLSLEKSITKLEHYEDPDGDSQQET